MGIEQISEALVSLGFPAGQSAELAQHLDRRARQLAGIRGRTYEDAVVHLLRLMVAGASGAGSGEVPSSGDGSRNLSGAPVVPPSGPPPTIDAA